MLVLVPWLAALGLAVLQSLARTAEPRPRRSVTACIGECTAMWIVEDGVLRVYAENSSVDCQRIVVDCSTVPSSIPGEVDGWPVRIRIDERMGAEEAPEQKAARLFVRVLAGRFDLLPMTTPDGRIVESVRTDPDHRRASFLVATQELPESVVTEARWICQVVGGVRFSRRSQPAMLGHGPAVLVAFERV